MEPLSFLLCVFQICSKCLEVLVYLAQIFLFIQYPVFYDSQYCSKSFHCHTKMEGIIIL